MTGQEPLGIRMVQPGSIRSNNNACCLHYGRPACLRGVIAGHQYRALCWRLFLTIRTLPLQGSVHRISRALYHINGVVFSSVLHLCTSACVPELPGASAVRPLAPLLREPFICALYGRFAIREQTVA